MIIKIGKASCRTLVNNLKQFSHVREKCPWYGILGVRFGLRPIFEYFSTLRKNIFQFQIWCQKWQNVFGDKKRYLFNHLTQNHIFHFWHLIWKIDRNPKSAPKTPWIGHFFSHLEKMFEVIYERPVRWFPNLTIIKW